MMHDAHVLTLLCTAHLPIFLQVSFSVHEREQE